MRRPNVYTLVTSVVVGLAVLGLAGGYVAQSIQYQSLLGLYTQQNQQLRDNGIEPTTPAPDTIAASGPAGATGAQGEVGPRGPGPTDGQVSDAVRGYCSQNNDCVGPQGPAGADGKPGTVGETGAQGPAGETGAPGPGGAAGADGRGVASVTCVLEDDASTAFRFTFTDQTFQDVAASCTPN